jgi:hypothetical protein
MSIRPLIDLPSEECAALIGRKVRVYALTEDGQLGNHPDHKRVGMVLDADRSDTEVNVTIDRPGDAQPAIFYAWIGLQCLWGVEVINDAFDVAVPASAEAQAPEQEGTIWDRTGIAMVDRVTDFLYHRITQDEELWEIFRHVPVGAIKAKFRQWLIAKLGGESDYQGDMSKHNNWPITDRLFGRVCDYALAGFMVEHVSREDLATIESVALAERKNVVSVE